MDSNIRKRTEQEIAAMDRAGEVAENQPVEAGQQHEQQEHQHERTA